MSSAKTKFCQGYHILVVDDEEKVAKFITEMLTVKGASVTTLNSSKEALDYFRANKQAVDLVITDQTMPEMTGTELVQNMLAERPELPIFLVTGYSPEVDEDNAESLGIREFISKPLRLADLSQKLQKHLPAKGSADL